MLDSKGPLTQRVRRGDHCMTRRIADDEGEARVVEFDNQQENDKSMGASNDTVMS